MGIMFDQNFNLDVDTKNILKVFLNDEMILRYLTIAPSSISDDVQIITESRPSIIATTTIQQRFDKYYLGVGSEPIFTNWSKSLTSNDEAKGRIFFYPGRLKFKDSIDRSHYLFFCFLPLDWHKKTNVTFNVMRRILQLFKDTRVFGDVGKVNFDEANPVFVDGYAGYQLTAANYNFVK